MLDDHAVFSDKPVTFCSVLIPSGIAVKAVYCCSYERAACDQPPPSPTHEVCLLSVDEMNLSHLSFSPVVFNVYMCA